jgi:hypothetical protein
MMTDPRPQVLISNAVVSPSRSMDPEPVTRPARWLLATLRLVAGIPAICGGMGLVAQPDGSLLHMTPSHLDHTPFSSFLIPGLLLLVVIGIGNTLAGMLVVRDAAIANVAGFAGGAALLTWIVAEMIFLRSANWLQFTYLGLAAAIMLEALRRRERASTIQAAMGTVTARAA